jgi:hypothetical protein
MAMRVKDYYRSASSTPEITPSFFRHCAHCKDDGSITLNAAFDAWAEARRLLTIYKFAA